MLGRYLGLGVQGLQPCGRRSIRFNASVSGGPVNVVEAGLSALVWTSASDGVRLMQTRRRFDSRTFGCWRTFARLGVQRQQGVDGLDLDSVPGPSDAGGRLPGFGVQRQHGVDVR